MTVSTLGLPDPEAVASLAKNLRRDGRPLDREQAAYLWLLFSLPSQLSYETYLAGSERVLRLFGGSSTPSAKTLADRAIARFERASWQGDADGKLRLIDGPDIFTERGISPEVRDARGYLRWTPEFPDRFRAAYESAVELGLLSKDQFRTMMQWSEQSPGYLIRRNPPPGITTAPLYPELRPDWAIMVEAASDARRREKSKKRNPPKTEAERRARWNKPPELAILDRFPMANLAKYAFMPSPYIEIPYWHDHGEYADDPKGLEQHLAKEKHPDGTQGRHRHTRKVKDKDRGQARRIDMNPLAVPLFENAKRVFFVIEGGPKADAILSRGEAVCMVPSVTTCRAPELPAFAEKYLRPDVPVLIVPDMDWLKNDQVIAQAMLFRQQLRRLGIINTYVAAPPEAAGHKGVDDFLGARDSSGRFRYSLDDLIVINREVPKALIRKWVQLQDGKSDGLFRDSECLQNLALHAGHAGLAEKEPGQYGKERPEQIYRAVETLAGIMDTNRRRVADGLASLAERPGLTSSYAITIQDSLETTEGMQKGRRGQRYYKPLDWEERPLITVAPEFRARDTAPVRLGDFEPGMEQFPTVDVSDALDERRKRKKAERQARWRAKAAA